MNVVYMLQVPNNQSVYSQMKYPEWWKVPATYLVWSTHMQGRAHKMVSLAGRIQCLDNRGGPWSLIMLVWLDCSLVSMVVNTQCNNLQTSCQFKRDQRRHHTVNMHKLFNLISVMNVSIVYDENALQAWIWCCKRHMEPWLAGGLYFWLTHNTIMKKLNEFVLHERSLHYLWSKNTIIYCQSSHKRKSSLSHKRLVSCGTLASFRMTP